MKPAWDQLAEAWKPSTSVLIADVDCTSEEGKSLCSSQGVGGYPTIKYYTAATGKGGATYQGGRSFNDLNTFVMETLEEECDAKTFSACSTQEKEYLSKIGKNGVEKWAKELARLSGMSGQAMTDDKRTWLLKRIGLLEQLLGKREPKKPKKRFPYLLIGGGIAGVFVLVLVYFCFCQTSKKNERVKEDKTTEEPPKEKEPEDKKDD